MKRIALATCALLHLVGCSRDSSSDDTTDAGGLGTGGRSIGSAAAHATSWTAWGWHAGADECKCPELTVDGSATPTATGKVVKAAVLAFP